ncbi:MAG: hypothetical protein FVQ85_03565 [Planctomycetes bacterium]|nr:hypothetical protein [Planctomycetota bacterium]
MIDTILAATESVKTFTRVSIFGILVFLCFGFIVALVIIGLVRLVKFLGTANKEMKLTRMEMGKLAEEVQIIRRKLENHTKNDGAAEP